MTPNELKLARRALGLSQSGLAEALLMSATNGQRTIRRWETDGGIPGPVQVAVAAMLEKWRRMDDGK